MTTSSAGQPESGVLGLAGKVVLVTGAAAGIGAATAALFAQLGATVVSCDRSPELGEGDDPVRRVLDVRDADALGAFVAAVVERHERIDVVVNNAGGTFFSPFVDVSPKGEAALIASNFTQVTSLVRLTVPHIPAGGSIVNVTSIEAHRAAPGYAVYAAMKAAQENLTRTLALELAHRGIRVNAMAPDLLQTEGLSPASGGLTDPASGWRGGAESGPAPDHYTMPANPPLGHWGTARDGAGAVVFLASDLARFVTGTTLHVDGGNLAAGGWYRPG